MDVEVITPEEHMGEVMAHLNSRRGRISEMGGAGDDRTVQAQVPLAELFGYTTTLRSLTKGRATHSMEPWQFDIVPENILSTIL